MTAQTNDNKFACARWIVDADGVGLGATHTTIASAIASASAGDDIFIKPGNYTEDFTMKSGVSINAFSGEGYIGQVQVTGKITINAAGSYAINGMRLVTNNDYFLSCSAGTVWVTNCDLRANNNQGMLFTGTSSAVFRNCKGDVAVAATAFYTSSSSSNITFYDCNISNSGSSATASSHTAATMQLINTKFTFPISTATAGNVLVSQGSVIQSGNTTCCTLDSGINILSFSRFESGSAAAINIGAAVGVQADNIVINSSNGTAAITGAGTINVAGIHFKNTGFINNVTTQTKRNSQFGGITFDGGTNVLSQYEEGTFTPDIGGSSTRGTSTTSIAVGRYTRIGNRVFFNLRVQWSNITGSAGNLQIFDLPFTAVNSSNTQCPAAIWYSNITFTAGKQLVAYTVPNQDIMTINEIGPSAAASTIAVDTAGDIIISGHYEV